MDIYGHSRKALAVTNKFQVDMYTGSSHSKEGLKTIFGTELSSKATLAPPTTCIICGEEPKLWGELGRKCADKFEIRDETSFRSSYPTLLRIGYGVLETLGGNMRNDDVRPVDKDKWMHGVAISPTVGYIPAIRFLYFHRLMNLIRGLDGDVVECGVGWGESLLHMATVASVEQPQRRIWGLDSFAGWPAPTAEDMSPRNTVAGDNYSEERLGISPLKMLKDTFGWFGIPKNWTATHITLVQGWFDKCLGLYTGDKIALLHLDCDLHDSYKFCLEAFYPKVVIGGIVAVDEYAGTFEQHYFPGARLAIDEYLSDRAVRRERDEYSGKYYFIKTRD